MKKKFPLVSIIIVNWNGGKVFEDCLKSLAKVDYPNWELIVVDNGSTDGSHRLPQNFQFPSAKRQAPLISNFQLIRNRTNRGFAVANNQGFEKAKGGYILLLNNDTKVEPDFLSKLVTRMERDTPIGVIQPKIFFMDKPTYLDNAGSFLTKTGFLQHWGFGEKDSKDFSQEREVFSTKGACMLVRRELIEKVALFDPSFVSYMEESDFCWRAWLAGYKVLFYPKAKILHKVGMTSKRMSQITINYHSFKNRIRSLIKNLNAVNLVRILIPHLFLNLFLGVYYLARFQFRKTAMIFFAIYWNIANLPSTLKLRKQTQRIRIKSDAEIFEKVMVKVSLKEMLSHFRKVEENF